MEAAARTGRGNVRPTKIYATNCGRQGHSKAGCQSGTVLSATSSRKKAAPKEPRKTIVQEQAPRQDNMQIRNILDVKVF